MIEVRRSVEYDAYILARDLRDEDRREVAGLGVDPTESMLHGIAYGTSYTITDDLLPVGIFGVSPIENTPELGAVWLLATPQLFERATFKFLRESKRWLAELEKGYLALGNIADPRNERHIAWLKWLGFTFIKYRFGCGIHGETYIEFIKPCAIQSFGSKQP
jgi:hypothetical protein